MINHAAVVGSGIMGVGIAQVLALAQLEVRLHDAAPEQLVKARQRIADNLQRQVEHGLLSPAQAQQALARIELTDTLPVAVDGADFIVEAIPERLDWKLELYTAIEAIAPPTAILVSNTSTFPISALTQQLAHPARFVIAHFFNPAELVPLVEIVTMEKTDEAVVAATIELLRRAGKAPVRLNREIPGFVANRLQAALLREALYLVQEGIVSAADLDTIVASGIGFRWAFLGPLEIADFGGLDTWQYVTENLFPCLDRSTEPSVVLRDKVAHGELGIKSGTGFYTYSEEQIRDQLARRDDRFISLLHIKNVE